MSERISENNRLKQISQNCVVVANSIFVAFGRIEISILFRSKLHKCLQCCSRLVNILGAIRPNTFVYICQ